MAYPEIAAFLTTATNERQGRLDNLNAQIPLAQAALLALQTEAATLKGEVAELSAWAAGIANGTIAGPK